MLIPRDQIVLSRDESGGFAATTRLLPECNGTGPDERRAILSLEKSARDHLRALQSEGKTLPEPFGGRIRRARTAFVAISLAAFVALALAVQILRPFRPKTAYHSLLPGTTAAEVRALLGEPDEVVQLPQQPGFLVLKQAGVATLWRYQEIPEVGRIELHFGANGVLMGKRAEPPEPAAALEESSP